MEKELLKDFNSLIKRMILYQNFPSLYEPLQGTNEFGPYGATIKSNMVYAIKKNLMKKGFYGVECPLISPEPVWQAVLRY